MSLSPGATPLAPLPALIADIGGTNARFAIVDETGRLGGTVTIATADFPTLEEAIRLRLLPDFLASGHPPPRSAVLALAGPIRGEAIRLTNCPWVVMPKRLIGEIGLGEVILLNDFEALSLSLPGLSAAELEPVGGGRSVANGTRLVLGPGTGLGAAALLSIDGRWRPLPGEGGHMDLAPRTERDHAIWPHIQPPGRVSGEALLCGSGLVRLYRAVARTDGISPRFERPSEITAAATLDADREAVEALHLFAAYLGRYAGNLALVFLPTGGVYLGGGITARIAPFLRSPAFRENFADKAPHRAILEDIATAIITHANPALAGLADFVRAPERFSVPLDGKRWR